MIVALLVALIVSALARPIVMAVPRRGHWLLALLPAGLFLFFLLRGLPLEGTDAIVETVAFAPSLGVDLAFVLDGFSLLFALLVTGIGTLVTIYAGAYFADRPARETGHFLTLILLFMTAMLGTVLADDLVLLFVFWEATSIVSFLLIGFEGRRRESREAALQSLLVTAGGGLALLAGILLIGAALDTTSLREVAARSDELLASPLAGPATLLILTGAFTKSAQVPFHFWLPAAMEAPTPASAYLHSATMVKLGVYLLARFDAVFAGMPLFGTLLVLFGSATMIVASLRALAADGYKAILAQSTVASLGVLVMLIGLDGEAAVTATIGFILAHALYKATLFFCAGTAIHATHEGRLSRLGGLSRQLPLTAAAACLAAVSMAGLPPTLGFVSKEYLFEGQLASSFGVWVVAVAVAANAVFVMIAGLACLKPFFGSPAKPFGPGHEGPGLVVGPLLLGGLGLLFGLAPGFLVPSLVEPAASALLGRNVPVSLSLWHGVTPMLALSALVIAIGAGLFLFGTRLRHKLQSARVMETLFGERGYAVLLAGTLTASRAVTRRLLTGDLRRPSVLAAAGVLAVLAIGLRQAAPPLASIAGGGPLRPALLAILALMVVGALTATSATSLIAAVVAVGVVGFGSALVFLLNGAPDLALTQFSVEVLIAVILTALLLKMPLAAASTRRPAERLVDGALAFAFAAIVFLALASGGALPFDTRLTDYFAETSYAIAHGRNVVNVILVDYRGIDTLGEIAVIAFAATGVWALLRRRGAA